MNRGFTLIELLLVVTIVAIIAAVSVPVYSRFVTQNEVLTTTDQLVSTLHKAQFYAMMSRKSSSSGWGVNYGSNTITLYQGSSYAARNSALDETFVVNTNVTVSGLGDVNFARTTGAPSATLTITVSGLNMTKTITLNSVGMVTRL